MLKIIHLLVLVAILLPVKVFSQSIVHHEILAHIMPETNEIKIVDAIDLGEIVKSKSRTFLLHDGALPKITEKYAQIKKLNDNEFQRLFPAYSRNKSAQNIPVSAYRISLPDNKTRFTLEYVLQIKHMTGSLEEGISDTAGLISPTGVYLAGESLWYPRFEDELVSFRLSVRLPKNWKSVSQGERIYIEDEKTYHLDTWQEKNPQDDIYLIAAKFKEYSRMTNNVESMVFLRTEDDALAKKYIDITSQYLQMYESLLGKYPYSKFALVENFWQTGFGMPSFTLLGSRIIRFPFIIYTSYPHELLHNWWGNSVYVDYSQGNWAEGLTAYLSDFLMKEQRGRGLEYRRTALQEFTNITKNQKDFPLKAFISRTSKLSQAVGYGKTLMMFHMLRNKIGDELFKKGLAEFYRQFKFKKAGYRNIEETFSHVAMVDLKPFFSQWVNRRGAPELLLDNVRVTRINKKYELVAEISQQQREKAFQLNIPVTIGLDGLDDDKRYTFEMNEKNLKIKLSFDREPTFVQVDPAFDLFRRLDASETPPALSQIFSAENTLIILASQEEPQLKNAYLTLAETWQTDSRLVKYDAEISEIPTNRAVWLFGNKNRFKSSFIKSLSSYQIKNEKASVEVNGENYTYKDFSIILVGGNGETKKHPMAFLSADDVVAISGLARKLPHYGKYSYLAFKGEAPTNVLKGQWPTVNSPLLVKLKAKSKIGRRDIRKPLIKFPG